jgi:hypothetical protein
MENSKRPTFLTVLCILTFIASAWGIFSGITSYVAAGTSSSVLTEVQKGIKEAADSTKIAMDSIATTTDEVGAKAGAELSEQILSGISDGLSEKNIKNNAMASILASILGAIGAFFMFNLKKTGFWIYLAGVAVSIIAPLAIYGGGLMGLLGAGWPVFSGILFTVLYGIHLKYMTEK